MGFQSGKESSTSSVNLLAPSGFETSLQQQLPGIIQALGRMSGLAETEASRLLAEGRQIPGAIDIAQIMQGLDPNIRGQSQQLIGQTTRMARNQVDDFLRSYQGNNAVSSALAGGGGSATLGRRLYGQDIGARGIADAVLGAQSQFNPLALGQQVGGGLLQNLGANQRAVGSLLGISSQLAGGQSDILSRELGMLRNLRLGASPRTGTSKSSGFSIDPFSAFQSLGQGIAGISSIGG